MSQHVQPDDDDDFIDDDEGSPQDYAEPGTALADDPSLTDDDSAAAPDDSAAAPEPEALTQPEDTGDTDDDSAAAPPEGAVPAETPNADAGTTDGSPVPPQGVDAGTTPPVAAGAPPAPEPLTVKAGGRQYALDGITEGEGGALVIPADKRQAYVDIMRDGLHHRTSWVEQQQRERQQAAQQVEAAQGELRAERAARLRAEKMLEAYDRTVSPILADPQELESYLEALPARSRALKAELALALRNAQDVVLPAEPEPEPTPEAMQESVFTYAGTLIDEQFGGAFDDETLRAVAAHLDKSYKLYTVQADRDYPEAGVRRGETVVNVAALESLIESHAATLRRAADARRAAAQNAASPAARAVSPAGAPRPTAPPAGHPAPPAVTTRAASPRTAPAPRTAGSPTTRAEWEADLARLAGNVKPGGDDFDD